MTYPILFVDDEKNVLSAVRRVFLDEDYDLQFALSGKEALDILAKKPVSVIVSDMRMPEMDGVTFLTKAQDICPDSVRMILSAFADIDNVMQAINAGHVWRYITKPWNDHDLRLTIRNAIQYYNKSLETKRLLAEVKKINAALEEKVKERTWQLQERNEILNMLIENEDIKEVIKRCCLAISKQLGIKFAGVTIPFMGNAFYGPEKAIPADLEKLAAKAFEKKINQFEKTGTALVLTRKEQILGILVCDNLNGADIESFRSRIESFINLITLSLSQQKSLNEAPDLLKNIDKAIGAI